MSRKCPECGKMHALQWEDMQTGEVLQLLEKCKDCFHGFGPKGHMRNQIPIKEQITLDDQIDESNLAKQMQDLEWKIIGECQ